MDKIDFQEKIWGFIFGIIAIVAACLEVVVNGVSAASILGAIKDVFGTAVVVVVFIAIVKDKFPKKQKSFEERLGLALDNWREENSNMIIRNPKYDEEHIGQGVSCYTLDLKTEVSDFYRPMGITKNTGLFLRMPVINKTNYNNGNVKIRFYLNKGTFFSDQPKDADLKSKYAYLIDLFTKLINEKHAGFACADGKGQEISVLIRQPIESDADIETMIDVINTMYTAYLVSANLGK